MVKKCQHLEAAKHSLYMVVTIGHVCFAPSLRKLDVSYWFHVTHVHQEQIELV